MVPNKSKGCGQVAARRVSSSRKVFIRDLLLPWLSSPRNLVGDLFFAVAVLLRNDGSPNPAGRQFLGDDKGKGSLMKKGGHPELVSGSTFWGFCRCCLAVVYKGVVIVFFFC